MTPSITSIVERESYPTDAKINGHKNENNSSQAHEDLLDLICVGFGPASLSVAITLHDSNRLPSTKFLCLERQNRFSWHSGMQLTGASMQISFLKDLATPRNPRSKFTFLNYLFMNGRLNQFINLSTFIPSRAEFEDYLRWCASHFEAEGQVKYGVEVKSVRAGSKGADGKINSWEVIAQDADGNLTTKRARKVVVAVGGRPVVPKELRNLNNVTHSSGYIPSIEKIQKIECGRKLRFAVVGSGQSAAEIFNDLWSRFPESEIKMIIKAASLRPSDDSPFVNEIFDPDHVNRVFAQKPETRAVSIALDRGTNYGVVRIELLNHIYNRLYQQRVFAPSSEHWKAKIISNRVIVRTAQISKGTSIRLVLDDPQIPGDEEVIEVDYVFAATGYICDKHEGILADIKSLLWLDEKGNGNSWLVQRDYRLLLDEEKVDSQTGIWLQGCNQETHGLSDTLLSILAIRGGELVDSIFAA